jgi:hypothetical protein
VEEYYLERIVGAITGQATVPIGDAILSTYDSCIGAETCEVHKFFLIRSKICLANDVDYRSFSPLTILESIWDSQAWRL